MQKNTSRKIALALAILWATTAFLYIAFGRSFVEACYRGESIGALNRIVAQHRSLEPEFHNLEFYQQKRTSLFTEVCLLFGLLESYLLLEARQHMLFKKLKAAIRNFFMPIEHPVNLAVFRIVFFGFFAWWLDLDKIVWFSQLPRELQVAPIGFGWFLHNARAFDPLVVTILGGILRTACVTAVIGFFARSSAFVVAALGLFLCGIPQSYGKIDFYHFMVWFAFLLSLSRCADVLSIDALIQARKRADNRATAPPPPSVDYGLPVRLIWTLMGVNYFFGGLWKAIDGRWNWIFSDNLRYHIYTRWYAMQKIPRFAHFLINGQTWFFQVGALVTILFELSFIVLVLFPRTRMFAAALGLFFHNILGAFMANIFLHLQVCYVSFLNWHRIFGWVGRRCFRQSMYIFYDGGCKRCRRAVSSLRVFDILERIIYVDATSQQALRQSNLDRRDQGVILHDIHALIGNAPSGGYSAWYLVAQRIPLLWLVYPLFFPWSKLMFGQRISRQAARPKTSEMAYCGPISTRTDTGNVFRRRLALQALLFVGISLIATNTAFGLFKLHGWPFTCGPTFNHIATPQVRTFAIERVDRSGNVAVFDRSSSEFKWLRGERLAAIYDNIYRHPERPELPTAFCRFLRRTAPDWADAVVIRFYVEHVSVLPTEWSKPPSQRKLFFECTQ